MWVLCGKLFIAQLLIDVIFQDFIYIEMLFIVNKYKIIINLFVGIQQENRRKKKKLWEINGLGLE